MTYRVVAGAQTRDPYPVYKFYNEPDEWVGKGTITVTCKDGRVDVKIMEEDSIKIHHLEVYSDDGPVGARLTEPLQHPERPCLTKRKGIKLNLDGIISSGVLLQ